MTYQEAAKLALDLISQVGIKAGDKELAAVVATRGMLHDIAAGTLVVGKPIAELPGEKA